MGTWAIDRPGVVHLFHADERGSIVAVTDRWGTVAQVGAYDEYGALREGGWTTRFGYTGQVYLPEAKLLHYKARAYDPEAGRFLQTDPIGTEGGINLYGYVGGDPVNLTDPSGLAGCADRFVTTVGPIGPGQPGHQQGLSTQGDCAAQMYGYGADDITVNGRRTSRPQPTRDPDEIVVNGTRGSGGSSVGDFWASYMEMRNANTIGADRYFHCKANSLAAQR